MIPFALLIQSWNMQYITTRVTMLSDKRQTKVFTTRTVVKTTADRQPSSRTSVKPRLQQICLLQGSATFSRDRIYRNMTSSAEGNYGSCRIVDHNGSLTDMCCLRCISKQLARSLQKATQTCSLLITRASITRFVITIVDHLHKQNQAFSLPSTCICSCSYTSLHYPTPQSFQTCLLLPPATSLRRPTLRLSASLCTSSSPTAMPPTASSRAP
jgi:hypothetical protein